MTEQTTNKTRYLCIDILKIVSMLMVILLHLPCDKIAIINISVPIFLVITGYNLSNSILQKNITFKEYYSVKNFMPRLLRFLIPFFIIIFIQVLIVWRIDFVEIVTMLLFGGYGPGSYYTPLIIQILLTFPLIFFFIKKNKLFIFLYLFLNILFEVLTNFVIIGTDASAFVYRISIFRQIFYIAGGCYIALYKDKLSKIIAVIFIIIGSMFNILLDCNVYKPILFTQWIGTTLPFGVLAIGLVFVLVNFANKKHNNRYLTTVSNSTYHIFLIQQLFFFAMPTQSYSSVLGHIFCILICFLTGTSFYLIEKFIKSNIIKRCNKKTNQV